jgi:uncharacterized protein (DUF58 family)
MSRLYAIPTANAAGFAFILGVMWYVGMAQGNGVAYLLFFLLFGVLAVSVPKSFLNLAGIKVAAESPQPAFAGQEISLPVELANESKRVRCSISVALPSARNRSQLVAEIPAGQAERTTLSFPATRRGRHKLPNLLIATVYPLGFLKVWRSVEVGQEFLVYPSPAGDPNLPRSSDGSASGVALPEGDDFAGVRPYQLGEAQRHIDWKAVARGHPLMSKQFAREEGGQLRLEFASISHPGIEERLSQLALWVVSAERARRPYSLILPNLEIPPGMGEAHYHRCLKALACYQ